MKRGINIVFAIILLVFLSTTVSAEVLVLNINHAEFSSEESVKIFGYVFDNALAGESGSVVNISLNQNIVKSTITNNDGYYEVLLSNLDVGNYNLSAITNKSQQSLSFSVLPASELPSYQILASSLIIPFKNPLLNITIKKFLGKNLYLGNVSLKVFYENGTLLKTQQIVNNALSEVQLPQRVGLYRFVLDGKKSFTVSVAKFDLQFNILDDGGNEKNIFKSGAIAYFQVQGFSNGQSISNASVTAEIVNPSGIHYTIPFTERAGIYYGNTNLTSTGTPLSLVGGDYEIKFTMKDSSNNEQKVNGFFSVYGLDVVANLIDKRAYLKGENAEFDIITKDLDDGSLLNHSDVTYSLELSKDGKLYDNSLLAVKVNPDTSKTSLITLNVTDKLGDGDYFLKVRANANGKIGIGKSHISIRNNQMFVSLGDSFGGIRDSFQPGELIKVDANSDKNISYLGISVYDKAGNLFVTQNTTGNSKSLFITFNAPEHQKQYIVKVIGTLNGSTVKKDLWFHVQNYFSFMDVINQDSEPKFVVRKGKAFLIKIKVFDVAHNLGVDLSDFKVKFDTFTNQRTQQQYTNVNPVENLSLSNKQNGMIVFNTPALNLPDGVYKVDYTLVDSTGKSIKGNGFFGLSDIDVQITTLDENGLEESVFSPGDTINITVNVGVSSGTATLRRDFFAPITFNITNGIGSILLTNALNLLPSESGWYPFDVKVNLDNGKKGIGGSFFEIRSFNFKSIAVQNNGDVAVGANILADLTLEKAGSLLSGVNVSVERVTRLKDQLSIPFSFKGALTDQYGKTTINISTNDDLEPGEYFVDLKAVYGNDKIFNGFGFHVVTSQVSIAIDDDDKKFSTSENIPIKVQVLDNNGNPESGVIVNLIGFLNLDTWGPLSLFKQGNTSSSGIATITVSAASLNPGKYAPVFNITNVPDSIVGFGSGEFEIKAFDTDVDFYNKKSSFSPNEDILINVSALGTVTVTPVVTDMAGREYNVDYIFSDGLLTIKNTLNPGDYFVDVSVTSGTNTITRRLWFEILAPQVNFFIEQNQVSKDGALNFNYSVFTNGANGWHPANATLIMAHIEDMWSGALINVNLNFTAKGNGNYTLDLSNYNLDGGDYFLYFQIKENPGFSDSIYFRVINDIRFWNKVNVTGSNATINVNTSGMSGEINYSLISYFNYATFEANAINEANTNGIFHLNDLSNGFYSVQMRIDNHGRSYFLNPNFEVHVNSVTIKAPEKAFVGSNVQFNISSGINTHFWILDAYTLNTIMNLPISIGQDQIQFNIFNYPGKFIYSYGNDKSEAFGNGKSLEIKQIGFDVEWSERIKYVIGDKLYFNVSTPLNNSDLRLKVRNHFSGQVNVTNLGKTPSVPNQKKSYNLTIDALGPQDLELILVSSTGENPKSMHFMDVYPNTYNVNLWADKREYNIGENVTLSAEVNDILNDQRLAPDQVNIIHMFGPAGDVNSPSLIWNNFSGKLAISNSFLTGNYHLDVNVSKGSYSQVISIDFFVKGNDNYDVRVYQDKWDFSNNDIFNVTIDVFDSGIPASDVSSKYLNLGLNLPEQPPTPITLPSNAYWFSNGNVTDENGRITFFINLSSLGSGNYQGNLNVGGQVVWFNFNLRTYMVDAHTNEWEYGITDAIQLNVRARDINTFNPLEENGTVKINEIRQHIPNNWQYNSVPLSAFGLLNDTLEMNTGETLIEMHANNTALQLTQPYEFEVLFTVNLTSGIEQAQTMFKLSNSAKPSISIVDSLGSTPEAFFAEQQYTLRVTGPENMTANLKNIWGPDSKSYNLPLKKSGSALAVNFTSPRFSGMYDVEVEIVRAHGFPEYLHKSLLIGSGLQFEGISESNALIGMNFSVQMHLFGSGKDPMCPEQDPGCADRDWFGPLANKTISLSKIQDLSSFTSRNVSSLGIEKQTGSFPDWMIPQGGNKQGNSIDCNLLNEGACNDEENCIWDNNNCIDYPSYCNNLNQSDCINANDKNCFWDPNQNNCMYNDLPQQPEGKDDMMMTNLPGDAQFNLNPDVLNLSSGKKYNLIFTYDDGKEVHESKVFVQVENFHVAISMRDKNLKPKSEQQVWLKTTQVSGIAVPNCSVRFSGIYGKDQTLVRTLNVLGTTDSNGEFVFNYLTPSLPDVYFMKGKVTCNVSNVMSSQDVSSYVGVGSKNLEVDMKTKYNYGDNIVLDISTKDRNGKPIAQKLEVHLTNLRKGFNGTVYPEAGSDCIPLNAIPEKSSSPDFLSVQTDEKGHLGLNLCPMPRGDYDISVYPVFDFGNPMDNQMDNDFGYHNSFLVSSIDADIISSLKYKVGDEVTLNITAKDKWGEPMNATIIALNIEKEFYSGMDTSYLKIYRLAQPIPLISGKASVNFTIPRNVTKVLKNQSQIVVPLGIGPTFANLLIQDSEGTVHTLDKMQFVIVKSNLSYINADLVANTNSLITIHAQTDNLGRYKAQFGTFFMQDNPDKGKEWKITNGVLFENSSNKSVVTFKILTPKEAGDYYLGIPILPLSAQFNLQNTDPMSLASEILLHKIHVRMQSINVSGLVEDKNGNPIQNALISIGKKQVFTNQTGAFNMEIPVGRKSMIIQKKVGDLIEYMETDTINFNENKEINVSFYEVKLSGDLQQKLYNITSPSFDLSTTKLRINVSINNTGDEDLLNFSLKGVAMSGEEHLQDDLNANTVVHLFLSKLYAGFKSDDYVFKIRMIDEKWNSSGYILVSGIGVNSSVGAVLEKSYRVETYATPGNGLDDDNDGRIDEEKNNNKDDDGDGLIDEDLEGQQYQEYCGNGFCSIEEKNSGSCFEDCAVGSVCGDNKCDDDELYNCPEDCAGNYTKTCEKKGECNNDGTFCNNFGLKEPANWCQSSCDSNNCWACSVDNSSGTTECEQKGCSIDTGDSGGKLCYHEMTCSANECQGCMDNNSCINTGLCEWKEDQKGGWCERPWICDVECGACSDQSSCENSPAIKDDSGCVWKIDGGNSWCEWNLSYAPPVQGSGGIIDNVWIALTNATEDYLSLTDFKNWSGNKGKAISPGDYYIILNMGGTNVNVSVNGEVIATIHNEDQPWNILSIPQTHHFDGNTLIEITDLIGPDYLSWNISFNTTVVVNSVCGNSIVEQGEDCDNGNLGGMDCNSGVFHGAFSGGVLSCDDTCHFNTSSCTPVASEASLSGQVNGSVINGANVTLYQTGTEIAVFNAFTNSTGSFNIPSVTPGVYDIDITMPPGFYIPLNLFIDNVNITTLETVGVNVPHIFFAEMINGQLLGPNPMMIENNTPVNFTILINNTEGFNVSAMLKLDANPTGDFTVYNYSSIDVLGGDFETLGYTFFPSLIGMHNLNYNLTLTTNNENVFHGSSAFDGSKLEIEFNGKPAIVNVTGFGGPGQDPCGINTDSTSCGQTSNCGWVSNPPPPQDPFCISCGNLDSQTCDFATGCEWSEPNCVGI